MLYFIQWLPWRWAFWFCFYFKSRKARTDSKIQREHVTSRKMKWWLEMRSMGWLKPRLTCCCICFIQCQPWCRWQNLTKWSFLLSISFKLIIKMLGFSNKTSLGTNGKQSLRDLETKLLLWINVCSQKENHHRLQTGYFRSSHDLGWGSILAMHKQDLLKCTSNLILNTCFNTVVIYSNPNHLERGTLPQSHCNKPIDFYIETNVCTRHSYIYMVGYHWIVRQCYS